MKRALAVVGLISVVGLSCSTRRAGLRLETRQNIDQARSFVLAEMPTLDSESKDMIATNGPVIGQYRMAGDYSQYFFIWSITSNRVVRVNGMGDMRRLENAKVTMEAAR